MRHLFAASFLCWALPFFAQKTGGDARYFFQTWTTRDGLPSNNINHLDFDGDGFLWMATDMGIVRFDGAVFKRHRLNGTINGPLSPDRAAFVFTDGLPGVFAINLNGELFRFETTVDSFRSIGQVWEIDLSKRKLAAAPFAVSDPARKRLLLASAAIGLRAFSFMDEKMTTLSAEPLGLCRQIMVDSVGSIWVSMANGLFRLDEKGQRKLFFEGRDISGGIADEAGAFFIEKGKAVHRFDFKSDSFGVRPLLSLLHHPLFFNDLNVEEKDANGLLWCRTDGEGVQLIDPKRGEIVRQFSTSSDARDGFLSDNVNFVKKRGNDIWLSTASGLLRTRRDKQAFFHQKIEGLGGKQFSRTRQRLVDPKRPSCVWLFSSVSGAMLFDEKKGKSIRLFQDKTDPQKGWDAIHSAIFGPDGRLFCAANAGLNIINPNTFEIEKHVVRSPNFDGKNQSILHCWFGPNGQLWLQTHQETGSFDLKTGLFSPVPLPDGVKITQATMVSDGQNGTKWVSFLEGIFHLFPAERRFEGPLPIKNARGQFAQIQCVLEDSLFLWVATFTNLTRYEKSTGSLKFYGAEHGLAEPTIKSLVQDERGKLWMNTQSGVCLFDPQTERFIVFDQKDGLAENNVIGHLTIDGGIICAGFQNDYCWFRPVGEVQKAVTKPVFTDFFVLGKRWFFEKNGAKIVLRNAQNVLEWAFSCPSFENADRIRFERQLVGFDPAPVSNGTARTVNYTNLDAGNYRLKIWAINPAGFRCPQPAVFDFEVLPPFYETWWFRALVLGAVAGIFWAIARYRSRQRLEKERIRLQIARDLHDDVGSTLSAISILSEAAIRQVDLTLHRERLSSISEKARAALFGISDIVWSVNPENDHFSKVIERMALFASETAENAEIELVFRADPALDTAEINMKSRRDLYLFFKEAVSNAARHGQPKRIEIVLKKEGKQLSLSVFDDGKGFDPSRVLNEKKTFGGNGLASLGARAASLGGHFSIKSQVGAGCRVELVAPIIS